MATEVIPDVARSESYAWPSPRESAWARWEELLTTVSPSGKRALRGCPAPQHYGSLCGGLYTLALPHGSPEKSVGLSDWESGWTSADPSPSWRTVVQPDKGTRRAQVCLTQVLRQGGPRRRRWVPAPPTWHPQTGLTGGLPRTSVNCCMAQQYMGHEVGEQSQEWPSLTRELGAMVSLRQEDSIIIMMLVALELLLPRGRETTVEPHLVRNRALACLTRAPHHSTREPSVLPGKSTAWGFPLLPHLAGHSVRHSRVASRYPSQGREGNSWPRGLLRWSPVLTTWETWPENPGSNGEAPPTASVSQEQSQQPTNLKSQTVASLTCGP